MNRQSVNIILFYYAKILLLFSIILISIGIVFQVNTKRVMDPIDDVVVIHHDDQSVSVTPADENVFTNDVSNKNLVDSGENQDSFSLDMDHINSRLKEEIEETYGVSIFYGKDTDHYSVITKNLSIGVTSITDANTINGQLNKLKSVLKLYPSNLFREIKEGGIPLSIYLIHQYTDNNITGITDSTYSYANISIAAIYPFEESFYHESYHYIERYLFKKGANFNSWDILNPKEFQYGVVKNNLSYSNTFREDAAFVNNYAQIDSSEDRASTFEYMMASNKAICLNKNSVIWNKARYLALTIETVLDSVSPRVIEYWERYL